MIFRFANICGFIFLVWLIGLSIFLYKTQNLKTPKLENINSDAIIILTGGTNRVSTALTLLTEGKASKLFISGVHKDTTLKDILSLNDADSKWECCITLDYKSQDTKQNAFETALWIQKNNVRKFILVTSSYHMPRAQHEFKVALEPYKHTIIPYPITTKAISSKNIKYWYLFISEYNKIITSTILHQFQ